MGGEKTKAKIKAFYLKNKYMNLVCAPMTY